MEEYLVKHLDYIKSFLIKNGFKQDHINIHVITNDKCEITFYDSYYDIHGYFSEIKEYGSMSSDNLCLYWF